MRLSWCLLVLLALLIARTPVRGLTEVDEKEEEEKEEVGWGEVHARQIWTQMDKDLKTQMNKIMRKALPPLLKEVYRKELSTQCLGALLQFTSAIKQTKAWAFRMLDSSGRIPEGFLSGTLTSLGNFEECLLIKVDEPRGAKLKGQYCNLNFRPPLPVWRPFTSMHGAVPELRNVSAPDTVISWMMSMLHNLHVTSIKVGVCTPSPCTQDDVGKLVQLIPEKLGLEWKVSVSSCETLQGIEFTSPQIGVLCLMGVVIALLLFGSCVDSICSSPFPVEDSAAGVKGVLLNVAVAFSMPRNARRLANYACPEKRLAFVNGLIFIVFFWVVISNTFMYVNYDVASNLDKAFRLVQELFYEVALNRVLPIQVFFFLSGLTTTYRWLKTPEKNPSIIKFLLRRYIRYTPAYALVLSLMLIVPTWGSGPSWNSHMNPIYQNCRRSLHLNLLYLNNFFDSSKVCLDHTWVFAVDAQLHVLAIFILLPLKLRPKIGLMLASVFAVASIASVALTNVYYDLPPNEMLAFLHMKDRNFYAEHSYYRVYSHIGLYCTGILVGYLFHKHPDLKVSRKVSCSLWALTGTAYMGALFVVNEWRTGNVPSPLVSALYAALSKVGQAGFLAWLSVACFTGSCVAVRDVLSWRPFAYFGRMTFIAYIMHVPIITIYMAFRKSHLFVSSFELFYVVLNHVAGTFVVSWILFVGFEAPFLALADLVRRRREPSPPPQPPPAQTEKPPKATLKIINNNSHC